MSEQETRQPMKEYRAGTISAAVWEKTVTIDGRSMPRHTIRIQKRYKDERSGEWKTTGFLRPDDLPKIALVAGKAYEHVTLREMETIPSSGD